MGPQGAGESGQKVVVAFLDRRRDRGLVYGFKPSADGFSLHPVGDPLRKNGRWIPFAACKAVYFVKSLEGNKDRRENKLLLSSVYRQGTKVSIHFPDGEQYVGTTEGFIPNRTGFFFYPGDPASNNIEVFVVTANADEIRLIGAEPDGTDKVVRPQLEKGVFLPEKRLEAVLRVLRGEPVEKVAREMYIPPPTLAGWRARYLTGGAAALGIVKPGSAPPK